MESTLASGPDPDEITSWITTTYPDTVIARAMFERLVGATSDPDHAALDRLLPHPVYAKQHWILNPGRRTFDETLKPLIAEAYQRLARRARTQLGQP